MDVLGWLAWALGAALSLLWSLVWLLIGGWVSTLLQIALLITIVYTLKYGWRRAPAEIWRHSQSFVRFFWNWVRARENAPPAGVQVREVIKVVRAKEFGDINFSTVLSLAALCGLVIAAQLQ